MANKNGAPMIHGKCAICDKPIKVHPWRPVSFCSNKCKQSEKYARKKGRRARCKGCGVSFEKTETSNYVNCPICRAKSAALQEGGKG